MRDDSVMTLWWLCDDSVMTLWLVTSSDYFVHLCTVIVCSNDSDDDLWETQSFDCNITFVSQQKYSAKKNPMRKRFLSTTSVQSGRSDWLGNLCHQAYSSQRNAKGVLKGVMRRQMWPWWPSFCPTLFEIWMWTSQRRITSPEMLTFLMHKVMNEVWKPRKGYVSSLGSLDMTTALHPGEFRRQVSRWNSEQPRGEVGSQRSQLPLSLFLIQQILGRQEHIRYPLGLFRRIVLIADFMICI